MQEHVELVPALAEVENDAAQAHSHIHQDNYDGNRRGYDAEATDRIEGGPKHESNNQGEYRLRYGCHVRRAVHRMGASERPGQNIDASHGVHYTGSRVYARVRVGDSAVHDGEEDNDPSYSPVPRRHGGPRVWVLGVGCHLVEAPAHHGSVRADEVEEPDHQRRGEDHPGYGTRGVTSFFSKRGRRLEADEGEDGEDHPLEDPRPCALKRVRGVEDLQGILAAGCEDHVQPEGQKRYYLEDTEGDACVGREPDAPVGQVENEYCGHNHPHPPRDVYAEPVLGGVRSGCGEDQVEERGDERFGQEKCPPNREAEPRCESSARVRVEPSGGGHLLGELAYGVGYEERNREGEDDRKRQDRPRKAEPDQQGEGNRSSGSHVRDRLEQHLRKRDGMLPQVVESLLCLHLLPPHSPERHSYTERYTRLGAQCHKTFLEERCGRYFPGFSRMRSCSPTRPLAGKDSPKVEHHAAGVAVGSYHEPCDDLDLLRIPRRVDHYHILRYVAQAGHGVLLGPALAYGLLCDFGWQRSAQAAVGHGVNVSEFATSQYSRDISSPLAEHTGFQPRVAERSARVELLDQTDEVGQPLVERGDRRRLGIE